MPSKVRRRMHRAWLRTWLVVFTLVVAAGQAAVGMRASATASITGDEPFYLLTTQSLLSDGDLDLADEYRNREYEKFWDGSVDLWRQMEPTAGDRLLSPHHPGLSVLVLPAYAVGGLVAVQRFLVVVWGAAMAFAALAAVRMGTSHAAAAVAGVAVGAGVPGLVYASQLYPEGPAALCVSLALLVVTARRARPVLLAMALTALAWLGVKYGAVALVLAGAWTWRFRSDRRAVGAMAGLGSAAALVYAWWHLWVFGGLTPYGSNVVWAGEGTTEILGDHFRLRDRSYRLYGVFLDARFGLIRWLPVSIVGVLGVGRASALAVVLVSTAAATAAFASITIMGWWFPGRLLVAVFPALVVLVAIAYGRLRDRAGGGVPFRVALVIALGLALWSLAVAAAVAWSAHTGGIRLAVDPWELGFPLPPGWLFPDFRSFGWREVLTSLTWGVGLAGLVFVARARRHAPRHSEAVTPTP